MVIFPIEGTNTLTGVGPLGQPSGQAGLIRGGRIRPNIAVPGSTGILPTLCIFQFQCGRDARAPRERSFSEGRGMLAVPRFSKLRGGRPRSQARGLWLDGTANLRPHLRFEDATPAIAGKPVTRLKLSLGDLRGTRRPTLLFRESKTNHSVYFQICSNPVTKIK